MRIEKLKSLSRSDVATIFKGNFVSKFVLVLGGLFLAKYYGANDYGIFSIYLSIAAITSILLSFGAEHLIILDTQEAVFRNNFNSANTLALLFSVALLMGSFVLPRQVAHPLSWQLGVVSGFLILYVNNTQRLLSKVKKFRFISFLTMCDAIGSFLMQSVFLYFDVNNGLIWGSFLGFLFAFFIAVALARKWIRRPDFSSFFRQFRKRKDLVTLVYPSTIFNALGNHVMPILLGVYFMSEIVGEYALATKILSVPLLLMSSSLAVVYYPKAVEIYEKFSATELLAYTKKVSVYNFLIILGLFVLLNTFGVVLLKLIFNKDWANLPSFLFILSFGFLARSLVNPIADVLTILKKNHIALYFNIYLFLINFLVVFISKAYGFQYLVGSFSFLLSLGYGGLYYYISFHLKKNEYNSEVRRVSNYSEDK